MVSERLSMLSSNQEIFNADKLDYQAALKSAGYKEDLLYTSDRSNQHQIEESVKSKKQEDIMV